MSDNREYKTVIFDLGRVLVNFDFQRGYRALEPLCSYPAAEIPARLAGCGLVEQFETGMIEPAEFVDRFSRELGLKIDYDHFCTIWSSVFTETLVPESMLSGLAQRYRLLMLSNTNAIHYEMLRNSYPQQFRHFHDLILSFEVKAMKPAQRIFEVAVERAGCVPEECFYTDDIAPFVAAARKVGIDAVQFESVAQLEGELTARGIQWTD